MAKKSRPPKPTVADDEDALIGPWIREEYVDPTFRTTG
jgi:hypothetical protein